MSLRHTFAEICFYTYHIQSLYKKNMENFRIVINHYKINYLIILSASGQIIKSPPRVNYSEVFSSGRVGAFCCFVSIVEQQTVFFYRL